MFKWECIQSKTEIEFVLNCILKEIKKQKIIRVFVLDNEIADKNTDGIISCTIDNDLYIQFENQKCLIINLTNENNAYLEYRELNQEEINIDESLSKQDLFNCYHEIHSWDNNTNEPSKEPYLMYDISLKYDFIKSFEVFGFNHSYNKWVYNGNTSETITIPAGGDYFNRIDFIMNNETKICICAEEALFDGYADVWIEDNNNNLKYNKIKINQ